MKSWSPSTAISSSRGGRFERCDNGFPVVDARRIRGKPGELVVQLEPIMLTLGTVAISHQVGELGASRPGFTSEESFSDLAHERRAAVGSVF